MVSLSPRAPGVLSKNPLCFSDSRLSCTEMVLGAPLLSPTSLPWRAGHPLLPGDPISLKSPGVFKRGIYSFSSSRWSAWGSGSLEEGNRGVQGFEDAASSPRPYANIPWLVSL